MDFVTIIGFLAAVFTTISFVPQVVKGLKTKKTKDVSLWAFSLLISGIFLWLVYGIMINNWPLILANSITFILASLVIYLRLKYA